MLWSSFPRSCLVSQSLPLKTAPQHDAVTTLLHRSNGGKFPPDVMLGILAKEFNRGFIRPENLVSYGLRVFRCLLANSKWAVMCLLPRGLATLSQMPDWCKAAERVVLLEGSPISREELCSSVRVTIRFLVTSLTKPLLPKLLSLAGQSALRRVLVVQNLNLKMMEATVFLQTIP